MRLGILLVEEVDIVGTHNLEIVLAGELEQRLVNPLFEVKYLLVCLLGGRFVAMELEIEVVAKDLLITLDSTLCLGHIVVDDMLRNLATYAGRAADEPLAMTLQEGKIGAWAHKEALAPRLRHNLHKVAITLVVLRQ